MSWLRRRFGVPRWLSSLGFVGLVLGLLTLLIVLLVPRLVTEIGAFGSRLVDLVPRVQEWVTSSPLVAKLDQNGLIKANELVTQIAAGIQAMVTNATGSLPTLVNGLLARVGALLGTLTLLTVMPVVLYYLLKDYPFITRRVIEIFPTLDGRRDYLVRAGGIVGSYLRGQLIIAAIAAFNIAVLLSIFGFPFAVLMGLVAGLLSLRVYFQLIESELESRNVPVSDDDLAHAEVQMEQCGLDTGAPPPTLFPCPPVHLPAPPFR